MHDRDQRRAEMEARSARAGSVHKFCRNLKPISSLFHDGALDNHVVYESNGPSLVERPGLNPRLRTLEWDGRYL